MEYREIVAVTGLSGLYQLLATKSDGAIVRNLADKSTKFISARLHNVTPLESIEVYTSGDNVRLHEVFQKMKDQEATIPLADTKADTKAITHYFKSVFPELDDERVYVSDMKKMLKWYDLLKACDLLNFEALTREETPEEGAETEEATQAADSKTEESATDTNEEKPAKKIRAKKSADVEAAAENEEKPKKIARKKKADGDDEASEGDDDTAKKVARKKKTEEE
jgi:hypothetical protein